MMWMVFDGIPVPGITGLNATVAVTQSAVICSYQGITILIKTAIVQ